MEDRLLGVKQPRGVTGAEEVGEELPARGMSRRGRRSESAGRKSEEAAARKSFDGTFHDFGEHRYRRRECLIRRKSLAHEEIGTSSFKGMDA